MQPRGAVESVGMQSSEGSNLVAEVLAALAYGESRGAGRARQSVSLAPDARSRMEQAHVADLEAANQELIEARLRELGEQEMTERFQPFFDAFFDHTEPKE